MAPAQFEDGYIMNHDTKHIDNERFKNFTALILKERKLPDDKI